MRKEVAIIYTLSDKEKDLLSQAINLIEETMIERHLSGEIDKVSSSNNLYDFIYKFNEENETVSGKLFCIVGMLVEIATAYVPDPADDKSWRENSSIN